MSRLIYILILVLISYSLKLHAQDVNLAQRKSLSLDTLLVDSLLNKSRGFTFENVDSVEYYAKKGYVLAVKIKYKKGEALGLLRLGQSMAYQGEFQRALKKYTNALALAESLSNNDLIARCYGNMAVLYRNTGNTALAIRIGKRAIEYYQKAGNKDLIRNAQLNLGMAYLKIDSLEKAKRILSDYWDSEQHKEKHNTLYLFSLAELYEKEGRIKKADSLLQFIVSDITGKQETLRLQAIVFARYSRVKYALSEFPVALLYARKALNLAIQCNDIVAKKASHIEIAKGEAHTGNYKGYYDHMLIAQSLNDSSVTNSVADLISYWENEDRAKELEAIKAANLLLQEKKNNELSLMATILLFVFILTSLFYFMFRKTKLLNDQLKVKENENGSQIRMLRSQKLLLAQQKDDMELAHLELKAAADIIERQAKEIEKRNKYLEEEVQLRTKEIADYNCRLEQFTFTIVHHLRAPVARIEGLINLNQFDDDPLIDKMLGDTIIELDAITRDLTSIVGITKDSTTRFVTVNLKNLFDDLILAYDASLKMCNGSLEIHFTDHFELYTVKEYFYTIFSNLIDNAIKFRNPDNKLTIRIDVVYSNTNVLFTIQDNGIGFNAIEWKDKLFRLYQRFHTHLEGRGTGLFLVKTLTELLGGNITVESDPMKGSCFTITMPNNIMQESDYK